MNDERTSETAWHGALAALCLGTAALHFSLLPPQWGASWAYGAGLAVAAWASVVCGAVVLLRPSRAAVLATVGLHAALVVAWIVVHTVGAPFGPASSQVSEPGPADTTAMALSVLAVGLGGWVGSSRRERVTDRSVAGAVLGCAATVAILGSTFGILASASDDGDAHGHGDSRGQAHGHDGGPAHGQGPGGAGGHGDGADHMNGPGPAGDSDHEHGEGHDGAGGRNDAHGQDDAGQGHSDDHAHGGPMAFNPMSGEERTLLGQQLVEAREVAMRFPTAADAMEGGYIPAGPVGAGGGAHFVNLSLVGQGELDIQRPMSLLFSDVDPGAEIIGLMYYLDSDEEPEGFAGRNDGWHLHTGACFVIDGEEITVPFRVDADVTAEQCSTVPGAQFAQRTGWMLHVWVVPGWESPHGVFSDLNPAFTCPEGTAPTGEIASGCELVDR